MKFLSWMHRKLMQNNTTEIMKNSTIGNPTWSSDQPLFDEHSVEAMKTASHSYLKCQKSSHTFEDNMMGMPFQEESSDLFDFLSIGTFGMELPSADPPTPTLEMPQGMMTNQQTDITENDLKLISYELEKFLEAEEKEIANDTSERNSQASITTLCNKPNERADLEGHVHMVTCPLQNYLFANATGLIEADKERKREKTSLEELFRRNSTAHNDHTVKCVGEKQHERKRNATNFMKKVVKKFYSSSSSTTVHNKNDAPATISIKRKLLKALKMLQKKVHPEQMTDEHIDKLQEVYKGNITHKDAYQIAGENKSNMILQATSIKNEKNTMKLYSNISKGASTTTGGHWIKTDSDYLVLEL